MTGSLAQNPPVRTPLTLLWMLTLAAVLLHGYHYGVQDQAIYLPAIKKLLQPDLYPQDSVFFLSQTRWMWFDEVMAWSVNASVVGLEWRLLIWHALCVFAALLGCWRLAVCCFATAAERWGAVLLVAAVLALPATGTQAPLLDNYVHPRNFATAAVLIALAAALKRRWAAVAWLAAGAVFHPLMAAIGAVHIAFVVYPWTRREAVALAGAVMPVVTLLPMMQATAWLEVLQTRRHLFPMRWAWYEWLGVIVPLLFLWWQAGRARANHADVAARVSQRVVFSTALFLAAALVVTTAPGLERLIPAQPMRGMHLTFLLFFFFAGAWAGRVWCRTNLWRWAALLLPVCAAMAYWQAVNYPATPHFEWPGAAPRNEWTRAFAWVRENTPRDAYFALDPSHMQAAGNDSHGFRALAERSMVADYVKDRAVAGLSPEIAPRWLREWRAIEQWKSFRLDDFQRLRAELGVTWVVGARAQSTGLKCGWTGETLAVCETPEASPRDVATEPI